MIGNRNLRDISGLEDFQITSIEPEMICFKASNPEVDNPSMLRTLLGLGIEVIWLQKRPQSLESAYLLAVHQGKALGVD